MDDTSDTLLERALGAVMTPGTTPEAIVTTLQAQIPEARVTALIRALLSADRVIIETFHSSSPDHPDATLARNAALILAKAADQVEALGDDRLTIGDLSL